MLDKILSEDDAYKNVSGRTANMINIVTGSQLKLQSGEESVNMCEAIREMRDDAIAEGKKEGLIEGKKNSAVAIAKRMIESGRMALEDIAEYTGLSDEEIRSLANGETI